MLNRRGKVGTPLRLSPMLLTFIAVVLFVAATAIPALAVPACSGGGKHIFVKNTAALSDTSGGDIKSLVGRSIDQSCQSFAVDSVHMSKAAFPATDWYTYVEGGWYKYEDSNGTNHLCEFVEKKVVTGTADFRTRCDGSTSLVGGSYARFREDDVGSPQDWHFSVNFLDGNGYHDRSNWVFHTSYTLAQVTGESEKLGSSTTMQADLPDLEYYKISASSFQNWPGNDCIIDEASDWDWHSQAANAYVINQNANAC